jgi:magnesium chelatase subunit H
MPPPILQETVMTLLVKCFHKSCKLNHASCPAVFTVGVLPTAKEAVATLVNIAQLNRPEGKIEGLPRVIADSVGRDINDIYRGNNIGVLDDVFTKMTGGKKPYTQAIIDAGFPMIQEERLEGMMKYLEFCLNQVVANKELGGIMELLNGEFLMPAPGGDPIRNADVLPTGRNMHALDPSAVVVAEDVTRKLRTRKLLEKLMEENGGQYPESIATLWGTDNIKTCGESLAQLLWRSTTGHGNHLPRSQRPWVPSCLKYPLLRYPSHFSLRL